MDFVRKTYSIFVLEVLPIVLYREVKPLSIWFYLPLLDNDVSMHDLVELFVASSTSQRSLKTESRRKVMNVLVLEVLPIVLYIEVKPLLIWF